MMIILHWAPSFLKHLLRSGRLACLPVNLTLLLADVTCSGQHFNCVYTMTPFFVLNMLVQTWIFGKQGTSVCVVAKHCSKALKNTESRSVLLLRLVLCSYYIKWRLRYLYWMHFAPSCIILDKLTYKGPKMLRRRRKTEGTLFFAPQHPATLIGFEFEEAEHKKRSADIDIQSDQLWSVAFRESFVGSGS